MPEHDPFSLDVPRTVRFPLEQIVSPPVPTIDDNIPAGYHMFRRDVRLMSGRVEAARYAIVDGRSPDPAARRIVAPSVIAGLVWMLQTPDFADNETTDEDRAMEIGNVVSYALFWGLTEQEAMQCYEIAFNLAVL